MNVQRLIIFAVFSLSAGLAAFSGPGLARAQGPVVYDDASGTDGTCTASGPADERVVLCTDLSPGRGVTLVEPGAEPAPVATTDPPPAPAPAPEAAPAPETTDTAVATPADQDADNAPDELEPGLGLDPTNPDTDDDGVADGDEPAIYGTDPLNRDTDGDGASDGEELFWTDTDPLVWNDTGAQGAG
jgi:hypothetical protein